MEPRPSGCQTENHLVDTTFRWKFLGRVPALCLLASIDQPKGPLWVNGESTSGGLNDKVHAAVAERQPNSLVLVQPERLVIKISTEAANTERARRRVRGQFTVAGHDYILSITDPVIEDPILRQPEGFTTELQRPILCISLSEKFAAQNACYKLIAGVIPIS
jgi:hypothetical protein